MSAERATYARRIFTHYFRLAHEASGLPWDSDAEAEIDAAIDDLIEAASRPPKAAEE